jgi:hypothetical protein
MAASKEGKKSLLKSIESRNAMDFLRLLALQDRPTAIPLLAWWLVLGRVNDSSSHDSILLAFFAGEREDSSLCQRLASRNSLRILTRRVQKVLKNGKMLSKSGPKKPSGLFTFILWIADRGP